MNAKQVLEKSQGGACYSGHYQFLTLKGFKKMSTLVWDYPERMLAILQGVPSIYETDVYQTSHGKRLASWAESNSDTKSHC